MLPPEEEKAKSIRNVHQATFWGRKTLWQRQTWRDAARFPRESFAAFCRFSGLLLSCTEKLENETKTSSQCIKTISPMACCGRAFPGNKNISINLSIYIYIGCRVKNLSKIWPFLSQKSGQGWVKNLSNIFFCLFFPKFYSVVGVSKKHK